MEMFVRERLAAATIVEYSDQKQAANRYPYKIVSPPAPSRCCTVEMEQVGDEQREREWPFRYMRCRECGYTVRRFGCTDAPSLCWDWDILESAAGAIFESRDAAGMSVPRDPWQAELGEAPGAQSEPTGGSSGWLVGLTS